MPDAKILIFVTTWIGKNNSTESMLFERGTISPVEQRISHKLKLFISLIVEHNTARTLVQTGTWMVMEVPIVTILM